MFANLGLGERANPGFLTEIFFGYWTYPKNVMIESATLCFLNRFLQIFVVAWYGLATFMDRGYENLQDSDWSLTFWGNPNEGYAASHHDFFNNNSNVFPYCSDSVFNPKKCMTPHFAEMHHRTTNEFFVSTFMYEQTTLHVPCDDPDSVLAQHGLDTTRDLHGAGVLSCALGQKVAVSSNGTDICLCGTIRPFFVVGSERVQFQMQHSYWNSDHRYGPGSFKTELLDKDGMVRESFEKDSGRTVSVSLEEVLEYVDVDLDMVIDEGDHRVRQNSQLFL